MNALRAKQQERLASFRVAMANAPEDSAGRLHPNKVLSAVQDRLDPDAIVVATGDGSFGFNAIELDTAVRHGAKMVIVVANNGAWQIEVSDQAERKWRGLDK